MFRMIRIWLFTHPLHIFSCRCWHHSSFAGAFANGAFWAQWPWEPHNEAVFNKVVSLKPKSTNHTPCIQGYPRFVFFAKLEALGFTSELSADGNIVWIRLECHDKRIPILPLPWPCMDWNCWFHFVLLLFCVNIVL